MFPLRFLTRSSPTMVARDFPNASFAFETIRGIDLRSKYPISLKNLIHLNGMRLLQKKALMTMKMDPITMKVSLLRAYRTEYRTMFRKLLTG